MVQKGKRNSVALAARKSGGYGRDKEAIPSRALVLGL